MTYYICDMLRTILVSVLLLFTGSLFSQGKLSDQAEISIITCGPGPALYSGFGHTAIRIHDPAADYDAAYNYGMFDFGAPNFYFKFARGKLPYWLSKAPFRIFIQEYLNEGRYVKEQLLNLTGDQKQAIFEFLEENAEEENKYYAYDFFFDNCATRPRDVLIDVLGPDLNLHKHPDAQEVSFRDIIDEYLGVNPWADLGIDLILGGVIDRPVTNEELMFLPDYVFEILEESTINRNGTEEPLVFRSEVLYEGKDHSDSGGGLHPSWIFWGLSILVMGISFLRIYRPIYVLDITLFTIFGLLGILVLFMWVGTNHQATAQNWNLLWTHPLLLLLIPLLFVKKWFRWSHKVFLTLAVIMGILILADPVIPQQFNGAVKPLIIALGFRYYNLFKWSKAEALVQHAKKRA